MSRLADRPDFREAIGAAAGELHIPAPIVEKDYWVTQALRASRESHPDDWILEGGTSLSKGYRLIQRFSEDIDVLVLRHGRGETARDRVMKGIATSAATSLGLAELPPSESADRGVHRTYALPSTQLVGSSGALRPTVLLEQRDQFLGACDEAFGIGAQHFGATTPRPNDGFAASAAFDPAAESVARVMTQALASAQELAFAGAPWPNYNALVSRVRDAASRL